MDVSDLLVNRDEVDMCDIGMDPVGSRADIGCGGVGMAGERWGNEVDATNGGSGREDKKPRALGDDEDEDGADAGPGFLDDDHCCMCAVSSEGRNIVVADLVASE
jgi:hypothetical protein